jgi:pyruvate dehydrogenase E2 component (dihydrolipoamide acetyltransferase)
MKTLKFVDVGEGITEGHLRKWLVKDGQQVNEDQPLVQIETDKAVVNIPAPISGVAKLVAKEDSIVKVGDILAYVGELSELQNTSMQPAQQVQQQENRESSMQAPVTSQRVAVPQQGEAFATPSVRHLARELGIDLSQVTGTGPNGRILENDVRSYMAKKQQVQQQKAAPKFSEVLEEKHGGDVERVPLSMTRKAIARNMEIALSIPSAAHMDLINATHLYGILKREKPNAERLGIKLTFLPFIIKATIAALKENPRFNASYDHEKQEVILKKYYNIGIAAEADDGLKVVVIRDADKKSIVQIAKELAELRDKLNKQAITIDEMRDSTFTITNIGSLGGGYLSVPIINPPEVAILGVHLIRDTPMVEGNQVKIGKQLPFSLVFDHRVVDGADAVRFGNTLIKYLEDPEFLEMLG